MSEEAFLSRKNLVQAAWAIVLALLAFVGGSIYERFSGPERVIVVSEPNDEKLERAESQANLVIELAGEFRKLIDLVASQQRQSERAVSRTEDLLDNVKDLTDALNKSITEDARTKNQASAPTDSIDLELLNRYFAEIERITNENITSQDELAKKSQNDDLIEVLEQYFDESLMAQVRKAQKQNIFSLPDQVKGYQPMRLKDFRRARCPEKKMPSDATIKVEFYVSESALPSRATPLVLMLDRVKNDGVNLMREFKSSYPLAAGQNEIIESLDLSPGHYRLRYGYYLWGELEQEFPPFYSKECSIEIMG